MKKTLFWSLGLAFVVGVGIFAVNVGAVTAQTGPVISNEYISVGEYEVDLRWNSDVSSTSKIEYGTTSGVYTTTIELPGTNTWFRKVINMSDLTYETTYYFRIVVTNLQGISINSNEYVFTTLIDPLNLQITSVSTVDLGPSSIYVVVSTNVNAEVNINYGTSSGNLNLSKNVIGSISSYNTDKKNHYILLSDLNSETTYYYSATAQRKRTYFNYQEDISVTSDESLATTTSAPVINSIDPIEGSIGAHVTIDGDNFGAWSNNNSMKYRVGVGCDNVNRCSANVLSWNNNQILISISSSSKSGDIRIEKGYDINTTLRFGSGTFWTIKGSTFTVTEGDDDDKGDGAAPTPTTINYISNAHGCNFSTSTHDFDTIQVGTLFTDGSDTDNYLEQVYNLYNDNWGRYPRCEELQFHLDHSTPIERLTSWLQEETIGEKYGCSYSTVLADESTIRVSSLFTLDSETDMYLGEVYNAYYDNWGRYPRCSEMQFQLDHFTSIERLTSWLEENKPEVSDVAEVVMPTTSSEIVGKKIEFSDSGSKLSVKDNSSTVKFDEDDQITFTGQTAPNSMVRLNIASENPMVVTTRSNDEGYWAYTLDGPLEKGDHTLKVTVLDNGGVTLSASEEVAFTVGSKSKVLKVITNTFEDVGFNTTTWIIVIAAAVIILILLKLLSKKKKKTSEEPKQE